MIIPYPPWLPCTPRQGHASMIQEVAASLGPNVKPGAVLVSVGGGGLLCGVIQGLQDVGWTDVPVVAMETVGADCFNAAVKAGRVVTLDDITRLVYKGVQVFCVSAAAALTSFPTCRSTVKRNVSEQRRSARKRLNTANAVSSPSSLSL